VPPDPGGTGAAARATRRWPAGRVRPTGRGQCPGPGRGVAAARPTEGPDSDCTPRHGSLSLSLGLGVCRPPAPATAGRGHRSQRCKPGPESLTVTVPSPSSRPSREPESWHPDCTPRHGSLSPGSPRARPSDSQAAGPGSPPAITVTGAESRLSLSPTRSDSESRIEPSRNLNAVDESESRVRQRVPTAAYHRVAVSVMIISAGFKSRVHFKVEPLIRFKLLLRAWVLIGFQLKLSD
jgi:hypothetical protein